MTTLLPTQNLSLYSIPLAYILALAPKAYAVTLYESSSKKKLDRRHPRGMTAKLSQDQSIDNATKGYSHPRPSPNLRFHTQPLSPSCLIEHSKTLVANGV